MVPFFPGLRLIVGLELRQRVRGVAWYVLLGIFAILVGLVTMLLAFASAGANSGGWLYSIIVYFVLLLGTLVIPALSGNAINGERDAGTLATTQVTLVSSAQIVLGKFLAAWISSLAFLAVSLPFIAIALALGNVSALTLVISALILALELGFLAAIGVGLSGVITRPLFSIVVSYLVIAALSIGTLISFGLLGAVTRSDSTMTYIGIDSSSYDADTGLAVDPVCTPPRVHHSKQPRFDLYWGILAANPYVVVADAVPAAFDDHGNPTNLFSTLSAGVRSLQKKPDLHTTFNDCAAAENGFQDQRTTETMQEAYNSAVPSWFVGVGIHLLLAAGALFWAWRRTETPARRLPKGSRIA